MGTQLPASPSHANMPPGGTQDIYYSRHDIVPLPMIERASGVHMWDVDGNEYIDASSGPMVSAIGHGNSEVIDAMAGQARRLDYAYTRVARNRPNLVYAERLAALAGPGFERVSLASGGSEAVDNAIKFLRQYAVATGQESRRRIISLMPSYHGATIATLAVGGNEGMATFMEGFAMVSDTIPAPLSYRLPAHHTQESYAMECAAALEAEILRLGPENVLAFIIEPVGGLSTGATVPPPTYFRGIRDICTRYGVYLVFDEILCGAGRTGKFITAHHWPDALPDIIVMAKGLGAGYCPLGAMLAPASMVDHLAELTGFGFSYSYNANPIACAAGIAVLDQFERHGLTARAEQYGARLRSGLEAIMDRYPIIGDVRGMGMLLAVEMVTDKESRTPLPAELLPTERIRIHGLRNRVMLYSRPTAGGNFGHWFMVAPPLTITDAECEELLRRTDAAVSDFYSELKSMGSN
ncbi:MAG: aspartate aminotransferase family protein [Proteobacteria bacterium]|nr:aspartate aminotransferase family protein [Pseudomonadota bacterium]